MSEIERDMAVEVNMYLGEAEKKVRSLLIALNEDLSEYRVKVLSVQVDTRKFANLAVYIYTESTKGKS